MLTGKAAGTTNLIVLDENGAEIMNSMLRVSSDIRQLTTVFYGGERQTFSCAPVCEQVISVGDDPTTFENADDADPDAPAVLARSVVRLRPRLQ